VLRGMFVVMISCIKKSERSQISSLIMYHLVLEKQDQAKPKISRWKEIMRSRSETSEVIMRRWVKKIKETELVS
jgi:hypothetical protein